MSKLFMITSVLHLLLSGCSNESANKERIQSKPTSLKTEENKQVVTIDATKPSEQCQFIFPAGIQTECKQRGLKTYFAVQSEAACVMTITDPVNKSELFISAEKMASADQAKRMAAVAQHMPGYIGIVEAGDGGHIALTTEKTSAYYDLHFSIKEYRCTISSKIKTGTEETAGIYFNENKLKELAYDWSEQLKDLFK